MRNEDAAMVASKHAAKHAANLAENLAENLAANLAETGATIEIPGVHVAKTKLGPQKNHDGKSAKTVKPTMIAIALLQASRKPPQKNAGGPALVPVLPQTLIRSNQNPSARIGKIPQPMKTIHLNHSPAQITKRITRPPKPLNEREPRSAEDADAMTHKTSRTCPRRTWMTRPNSTDLANLPIQDPNMAKFLRGPKPSVSLCKPTLLTTKNNPPPDVVNTAGPATSPTVSIRSITIKSRLSNRGPTQRSWS